MGNSLSYGFHSSISALWYLLLNWNTIATALAAATSSYCRAVQYLLCNFFPSSHLETRDLAYMPKALETTLLALEKQSTKPVTVSTPYVNLRYQGTKAMSDVRGQCYISRQADTSWLQSRAQPICIKVTLPAYHQYDSHILPPVWKWQ